MSGIAIAVAACALCVVVFRQANRDLEWIEQTQRRMHLEQEEFNALLRLYLDDAKARGIKIKPIPRYTVRK